LPITMLTGSLTFSLKASYAAALMPSRNIPSVRSLSARAGAVVTVPVISFLATKAPLRSTAPDATSTAPAVQVANLRPSYGPRAYGDIPLKLAHS
jgi:hypothetical protein